MLPVAILLFREKEALGIIPHAVINNFETVRTPANRNNKTETNTAHISPMLAVEHNIVELIDQLGKMHLPIT